MEWVYLIYKLVDSDVVILSSLLIHSLCAIKSIILLNINCPQVSKPNLQEQGKMEKKPCEKPDSVEDQFSL